MTEFRENLIISTNILLWVLIGNYIVMVWFDPISVSDRSKDFFAVFAGVSLFVLIIQLLFAKVIDAMGEFLKNYEIKPKQRL